MDKTNNLDLLNKLFKTYKGLKYEILIYSDRIIFNVLDKKFIWNNNARLWGGELEFDLNTFGVKGLGKVWTEDVFQIFGNRIKTVRVVWTENPFYPNGQSLGYKQFYEVYDQTFDVLESVKNTNFYDIMSKKGFGKIKDAYENKNSIIVILTR